MNRFAEAIKDRVPMAEMMEYYGIPVSRSGYARRPFHNEKTGSLRIYPGNRGWYCWGCHAHGSVIDFVSQYFHLSFLATMERINIDFQLGLALGQKETPQERMAAEQRARQVLAERAARENARVEAERAYMADFRALMMCDYIIRTRATTDAWSDDFAFALNYRSEFAENLKRSTVLYQMTMDRRHDNG